jgi:hypothetical protein
MGKPLASRGASALAATLFVHAACANGLSPVTLDAHAIAVGRIRTIRLKSLQSAPLVTGYGLVLDPAALVRQVSLLISARASLAAAAARTAFARENARRARHLYLARHNIAKAALQRARTAFSVAEAQRSAAAAMLAQARTTLLSKWGARLAAAALTGGAPLPALESGTTSIVEVSLPLGEALGHPPASATGRCPGGRVVRLHLLGRAPSASAGIGGQSLLYLMRMQSCAPIGTPLAVTLQTSAGQPGVQVPRSAVVWRRGMPWVFRLGPAHAFLPLAIPGAMAAGKGYFLPSQAQSRLHAGERIVDHGAALLYSAAIQSGMRQDAAAPRKRTSSRGG